MKSLLLASALLASGASNAETLTCTVKSVGYVNSAGALVIMPKSPQVGDVILVNKATGRMNGVHVSNVDPSAWDVAVIDDQQTPDYRVVSVSKGQNRFVQYLTINVDRSGRPSPFTLFDGTVMTGTCK